MKIKKILVFALALILPLTGAGKERLVSSRVDRIKTETAQVIDHVLNQELGETDNPDEVFTRAINGYKNEFKDYLNVTALNVQDKETVSLPDFDINYVSPEFFDVMYSYQNKLEMSLTTVQKEKYESLRKQDYNFDRYVSLNNLKYSTLDPSLKYVHDIMPINPTVPITPMFPTINSNVTSTTRAAAVATAGIVTILTNSGLGEVAISAFTACISTMTTGLSTSWIPFVGWALAVALVVGALIALTVIIVKNWDKIKTAIETIKSWFLEQFSKFSSFIESFFQDAVAQGKESTVAQRREIGGRTREFIDTEVTVTALSKIVDDCKKNDTVYLLGHIGDPAKGQHWWICYDTTDSKTVIEEKLYETGVCTYTWYNNTAKRMMAFGSRLNGDYSSLIYERPDEGTELVHGERDLIGWNHYHVGKKVIKDGSVDVVKYDEKDKTKVRWAHSMFGKLAYRNLDESYSYYPEGKLS